MLTFLLHQFLRTKGAFINIHLSPKWKKTQQGPLAEEQTQSLANTPPGALRQLLHSVSQTTNSYRLQFVVLETKCKLVRKKIQKDL